MMGLNLTMVAIFAILEPKKDEGEEKPRRDETRFQFEDMFNGKFYFDTPNEKWISGKLHRFQLPVAFSFSVCGPFAYIDFLFYSNFFR